MKRIYAESMLINRHLLKVLKDLDYGLAEKGIRAIVLKGAALLNTVYKDIALRPMEDIDVMVRPENIHDLKEILEQMGFLQNTSYPYSFQRGILSVDIHFDFLSSHRISSRREVMDICREHVWESAVPFDSKPALRRLSINNHFLALSFHLLKHRYDRLIWFVDIAESILKYESALNWSNLIHYAGQVKGDRILLYVLILMKHLIGGFLPEEVLIELGKGKLSTVEQYILRLRLMDAPLGRLTDLLWLYQIRGIRKKIGFLRENLFPKREIMNQIFPESPRGKYVFLERSAMVSSQVALDVLSTIKSLSKRSPPSL
jgi:hypothetical protein